MYRKLAALLASVALVACAPIEDESVESSTSNDALSGDDGFEKARSRMEEIRGDLASNQAHLRGTLTPAQTAAYSSAFFRLDRVVAASNDYTKKAVTLGNNLAAETAKLDALSGTVTICATTRGAVDSRIAKARDLYDSAKLLATSNVITTGPRSPAYAVRGFYTYLLKHPDVRACVRSDLDDLEKDLGPNHAQVIVQTKLEDPVADSLTLVKRSFAPLGTASSAVTTVASTLEKFARTQDGATFAKEATTPSSKLAGGVLAILDIGALSNDLAHRRYNDFLVGALKGGVADLAGISEAVSLLEGVVDSGRAGSLVTRAAGFAKLTGRIAAGVGVVTSTIQLFTDLERYDSDRFLHLARIGADAAALQASIIAVAGLAELVPVAGTIVLLTQTVLLIAEYWHKHEVASRRNTDTKAVLRMIGLPAADADTLADADNATLRALTQKGDSKLALAPSEVQKLATLAGRVSKGREAFFIAPDNVAWVQTASEIARIWSLSSASSYAMIEQTVGTDGVLIRVVLDGCIAVQAGVFANKQGFAGAVTSCRKNAATDERAAMDRLTAFLATH